MTFWTAPAPAGWRGGATAAANAMAWPAAVVLIVHRLAVLARTGSVTDDFTTVWSAARRFVERVPVYNEVYHHVNPHYLYNPGATLLLAPLGLIPSVDAARPWFILANTVAIIAALAWLTLLSGRSLRSPVLPAALALGFATEAVTNTLVFSNINGILLLALVAFIACTLDGRQIAAGVIIGLTITVKPMFLPLLVLPLMRREWRALLAGVSVPVALNAIAWPLTPGAGDYLTKLVPYLGITRDYANSSLAGFAVYFGMPEALHTVLFVFFGGAVAVAVIGLARWRYSDPWLWITMTSGVLLAGVCLLSSLGQAYYSMMLFPALFTVLHKASPMHTPAAWLGALLCLSPLSWVTPHMPAAGGWLDTFLPTAGWAAFILAAATWVVCAHDRLQELDQRPVAREAVPRGVSRSARGGHRTTGRR